MRQKLAANCRFPGLLDWPCGIAAICRSSSMLATIRALARAPQDETGYLLRGAYDPRGLIGTVLIELAGDPLTTFELMAR
jgi:hypothetical protein